MVGATLRNAVRKIRTALLVGGVVAGAAAACRAPSPPPRVATVPHPAPSARAPELRAAPTPLRRLSNEEYDHAVRDLVGDTTRPAEAFPPDDLVGGFESDSLVPVTALHVERYVAAAEAVADEATRARLDAIAPCAQGEAVAACGRRFVERFGRLAFRRRLDPAERDALVARHAERAARGGHAAGVRAVLAAVLASPKFLYRVEPAAPGVRALSGEELATRLAFLLWTTTPDEALLDEAEAGRLATAEGVAAVARRMLADPRAASGARSFVRQWLGLRELATGSKDPALYPSYGPELRASMIEETLRFGAEASLGGGDVVRALFTSTSTFVDARLAKLYGLAEAPANGFARVSLPARERAGLLTQASVLAVTSGPEQPSPILRGKLVRERFLCQPIEPPPPGAAIAPPKADPSLTTKQRFERHRTDPGCTRCHELMDPIGFGLDHYDAIGAWRTKVGPFAVDAVGEIAGTADIDGAFDGAVELGARLAKSPTVRRCVATQWMRAALGRAEAKEDAASLDAAYRAFERAGFDARELVVAIVSSDAFRLTRTDEGTAP
jgi:hypothetical protein